MSVRLMTEIWKHATEVKSERLLVLLALADWANEQGVCWPKMESIAAKTRTSRGGAIQIVQWLENAGYLSIQRGHGRGNNSIYHVHPTPLRRASPAQNPVPVQEPVVIQEPVRVQKPVQVQEPVPTQKPLRVQEPSFQRSAPDEPAPKKSAANSFSPPTFSSANCPDRSGSPIFLSVRNTFSERENVGQDATKGQPEHPGLYSTRPRTTIIKPPLEPSLEASLEPSESCSAEASRSPRASALKWQHGSIVPLDEPLHAALRHACHVTEASTEKKKRSVEEAARDLLAEGRTPAQCRQFVGNWWQFKFKGAYFGKAPGPGDLRDHFDEVLNLSAHNLAAPTPRQEKHDNAPEHRSVTNLRRALIYGPDCHQPAPAEPGFNGSGSPPAFSPYNGSTANGSTARGNDFNGSDADDGDG